MGFKGVAGGAPFSGPAFRAGGFKPRFPAANGGGVFRAALCRPAGGRARGLAGDGDAADIVIETPRQSKEKEHIMNEKRGQEVCGRGLILLTYLF